jgi:hypothetical protein
MKNFKQYFLNESITVRDQDDWDDRYDNYTLYVNDKREKFDVDDRLINGIRDAAVDRENNGMFGIARGPDRILYFSQEGRIMTTFDDDFGKSMIGRSSSPSNDIFVLEATREGNDVYQIKNADLEIIEDLLDGLTPELT